MDENSPKPVILELSSSPAGISAVRIPENITLCYLATQCLLLQQVFTSFTVFQGPLRIFRVFFSSSSLLEKMFQFEDVGASQRNMP